MPTHPTEASNSGTQNGQFFITILFYSRRMLLLQLLSPKYNPIRKMRSLTLAVTKLNYILAYRPENMLISN